MYSLASYYEETGQKELYEQQLDTLLLNKKVASDTKLNVMRQFIVQNEQAGKDSTRVITLFNRIMEQEPDEAQLPLLYAQYLLSKGMNKEAGPVLRQVLAIDPTNTAARMTLLGEAVRQEDYKEIMNLCEAGVESNPDMLEFYFYLTIAYNQAERTDDALAICQRLCRTSRTTARRRSYQIFMPLSVMLITPRICMRKLMRLMIPLWCTILQTSVP